MAKKHRPIPPSNEITTFFHCRRCLEELPAGTSPREWVRMEAGFTALGIQVWCVRHEANILHVDFEGKKHPANANRLPDNWRH
jgi:hypothetical protein